MLAVRTKKEVIIRLPASVNTNGLQDFLNYARCKELTSTYSVPQQEVDKLADEVNRNWGAKHKKRVW